MKTCIESGCTRPQFGGGYCAYHQWIRRRKGGDLYAPKKRQKPINNESPKRKQENKHYLLRIKEFWENAVNNGTNQCFFCGETMKERGDIHHIKGRGKFLLEEEYWINTHRDCHMAYHFDPADKLRQYPWFSDFMERLREKSPETYYKVLNKINKAELQFEE